MEDVVSIFYAHLVYSKAIWYILGHFGIFCCHLIDLVAIWYTYFVAIWYILWLFGIFFPFLICCTKKNLATLAKT
jgi:hypothetical protein